SPGVPLAPSWSPAGPSSVRWQRQPGPGAAQSGAAPECRVGRSSWKPAGRAIGGRISAGCPPRCPAALGSPVMNPFLVPLVIGFGLGVMVTILVLAWLGLTTERQAPAPDSRERVLAQVLLHQARRSRQLAELERYLSERAEQRLKLFD